MMISSLVSRFNKINLKNKTNTNLFLNNIFNNNNNNRFVSYKSFQTLKTDYKFSQDDEVFQEIKDFKKYEERGNYSAAKSILNRSLSMVESTVGAKHPITLNVLFRMVNLELIIGDLSSAERYANQVISRLKNNTNLTNTTTTNNDIDSQYLIPTLNYLLICSQYQGDTEKCFKIIDEINEIAKKNNDWELLISTLLNKAIILSLDCNESADKLYKELIELSKQKLNENDKLNESILSNYACYLHSNGNNDELAEQLYKKSIELAELNKNDIELVNILSNYGEFLFDSDQFDKAEPILDKAISKSELVYGRNNPKVGTILYILGKLNRDKRNLAFAEGFFNKCITIFEDYKNQTKRKEQERQLLNQNDTNYHYQPGKRERELRINKEVDIDFGNVLWDYAQMLRDKGRLKEAENLEQRARKLNSFEDD
ncbi:hypothetical protein ACTFIW_012910 [Dictyostelium discoideum]